MDGTPGGLGGSDRPDGHGARVRRSGLGRLARGLDVDALVRRHEEQAAERARAKAVREHERAVARRERVLVRARRAVPLQAGVTVVGTLLVVLSEGGDWVWTSLAVLAALRGGQAVATLRHPPPVPAPPSALTAPARPPSPAPGSAAWPAVLRLDRTREQVARLAPLVGPGGQAAAAEALSAADEADTALRWQAARLAAVEPHRGPDEHLLTALLDGVACQERLVAAFADLVAASDPRTPATSGALQDATDRLHGLADGLRELR